MNEPYGATELVVVRKEEGHEGAGGGGSVCGGYYISPTQKAAVGDRGAHDAVDASLTSSLV